jgi:hypothetical protein
MLTLNFTCDRCKDPIRSEEIINDPDRRRAIAIISGQQDVKGRDLCVKCLPLWTEQQKQNDQDRIDSEEGFLTGKTIEEIRKQKEIIAAEKAG